MEYPAWLPLTEAGHKACRNHRPESLTGGRFLCWGFPSHDGCSSPVDSCPRGKHGKIKTTGLHPLIHMQLALRGGNLMGKKILPDNVDGHVQALRLQLSAKDFDIPKDASYNPRWWKKKEKAGGDCAPMVAELAVIPAVVVRESDSAATKPQNDLDTDRETNPVLSTAGTPGVVGLHFAEGTNLTEPAQRTNWTKPIKPWGAVYRAGETIPIPMENQVGNQPTWGDGALPPGIIEFDFTPMEEGARRLTAIGETWKTAYLASPLYELGGIAADYIRTTSC